jgi:glycosyltransferase involved in cell wall biosynthesis
MKLSAVIITYNEEATIERCISSLEPIADEIVVIDSSSTDRTRELAAARGARVIERAFTGFTDQKNFAAAQATYDHVLSLDADEFLSPALAASIQQTKEHWPADGYTFNRLNHYGGKPIKTCGWYPDSKIRLWDRRKGQWRGGLVHEVVEMQSGAIVNHLHGDLMHVYFQNAGQLLQKVQQYSGIYAKEHTHKKSISPGMIFLKTFWAFFKSYIIRRGFTSGYEGFIISASNANGVLYKYAKLLEANRSLKENKK